MSAVDAESVAVFAEPVAAGDGVTIRATASVGAGHRCRHRVVARIVADAHGVRVEPVVRAAPVVLAAAVAIAAAIFARRR